MVAPGRIRRLRSKMVGAQELRWHRSVGSLRELNQASLTERLRSEICPKELVDFAVVHRCAKNLLPHRFSDKRCRRRPLT